MADRSLDTGCPVVFIDAIHVKIRDNPVLRALRASPSSSLITPLLARVSSLRRRAKTAISHTCSARELTNVLVK